jgi:opacity protein-like surface antigen
MKKLLIGAAIAAMMMTPVAAKAGNDWVGPAIAGTIFGVIIGSHHGHHNNNTTVIVREPRHHYRPHRRHRRHVWVEVCKTRQLPVQDHYGDYYTEMIYDCRMVRKARW